MKKDFRPAVFLDRDGTLIEDVGVLKQPEDVRLLPDTVRALRVLQKEYIFIGVSNQSGVVRGEITMPEVDAVNRRLDELLAGEGVKIEKWYVCPHERSDGCSCIKPNPTFLLQAAAEFDIALSKSFIIGDHPHDVFTGDKVGTFGLYVLTGHGERHLSSLPSDRLIFHTLLDAAEWILNHRSPQTDLRASVENGALAVSRGGLTAFPTETVYGLGADAFNGNAVARIFEVKERPLYDPLIVHVAGPAQARRLTVEFGPKAERLAAEFWPGPLSMVLPKASDVPDIVTAGHPTVAVRMPQNPIALDLIRQAETPIAAPSANRFGCTSPTTAKHVASGLGGGYDVLIDGGACRVGIESTVVSLDGDKVSILRPGGTSREAIEAVVGPVSLPVQTETSGESPGMLRHHYAPKIPLYLFEQIPEDMMADESVGKLLFVSPSGAVRGPAEVLSRIGDVREAALNLYAAMRRLDALNLRCIVSSPVPDQGLGRAVNDRLTKASAVYGDAL